MKKIIAAFDGLKFSESTKDYAIYLAKRSGSHLVGVFLDDFTYHSYKIYDLITEDNKNAATRQKKLEANDLALRSHAVENFETACREAGIDHSIHHDRNIAIQELVQESTYADLLIINSHETLTHYNEKLPTEFIRDLLSKAHCPVLIVPQKFHPLEKLAFLFDGEPSSVYAIKMFSYVLGCLQEVSADVLSVNSSKQSLHVPDNRLMKELMKRHFPAASYTVLQGSPEDEITGYLKEQEVNALVITGAYGRGTISRWFRESMANLLMKDLKLPLFIAHNK